MFNADRQRLTWGRRLWLLAGLTLVALAVVACGDDSADATSTAEPEETATATAETTAEATAEPTADANDAETPAPSGRTVEHEFGTTELPATLDRIVALDEYAGLDLLSVGIVPAVVFTPWGSEIGQDLLAEAGSELIPAAPTGVGTEEILAQNPDLVVFTSIGDPTIFQQASPAVAVLPFPGVGTSWQDKLAFVGEALDRSEETDAITANLLTGLEQLQTTLGTQSLSVSVLIHNSGILASATGDSPSTPLLLAAGFDVPEAQQAAESGLPYGPISEELLATQDADVILVFSEGVYNADAVTGAPTFGSLQGDVVLVNGDMWFGTHSLATFWMLSDLEAIAAGDPSGIALQADASSRLDSYQSLVG